MKQNVYVQDKAKIYLKYQAQDRTSLKANQIFFLQHIRKLTSTYENVWQTKFQKAIFLFFETYILHI